MQATNNSNGEPRRVGRPVTLAVKPVSVMLNAEMIAWGKSQEGGLSAAVRRLLEKAMRER